jgi:hypothetical protein
VSASEPGSAGPLALSLPTVRAVGGSPTSLREQAEGGQDRADQQGDERHRPDSRLRPDGFEHHGQADADGNGHDALAAPLSAAAPELGYAALALLASGITRLPRALVRR